MISLQMNNNPEAAVIVAGDFNHVELKAVFPKFHRSTNFPTRKHPWSIQGCFSSTPGHVGPHLCESDPCLQTSDAGLQDQATRTVQVWTEEASSALQDNFECTDWEVFKEGTDLDGYTSSVLSYLKFCTDAVLPTKTIKVFPNQKPWLDSTVKPLLKACDAAYRSGDKLAYSIAQKELKKGIKLAKSSLLQFLSASKPPSLCLCLKESAVTCLNDYRPVTLTPVIMKCFERIILKHIKDIIPAGLNHYQFTYRSTEDAVFTALHTALTHLQLPNIYVRMLFVDFSSAFNTVIPDKLILKLHNLGLPSSLCHWIRDFLTNRPQVVRIRGQHILYTGPEHRHTTGLRAQPSPPSLSSPVTVLPSTPQTTS
ncbi:hypothetical protein L3Q82_001998 [Scortum barcoo]|uniref:Uncharacterized protein n=1 Tax=Scortum barcoo TaxID=214431 RepID=A0ACB8W1F9_9TELE|nr:hypothetical protein L3Q82_001998 [Scortum barcoo]